MARVVRAAATLLLLAGVGTAAAAETPRLAGVDEAARDAVAAGDLPGAVIVIGRDGGIVHRSAVGSRALVPAAEPMTLDTIFDVASLTKVVATTPAVLALWEDGKLDLDAPLGRYLREFDEPAFREVTVRRVLTHSAGFPDLPRADATARGIGRALTLIARTGLASPPGAVFRYSDTGFIALAELVRRVSGESLDHFVARRFYTPLGMRTTRFLPPAAWRPRIAPTEALAGAMLRGVVHDGNARQLGGVAGHAGLFSTADDLARFCQMLLDEGTIGGRRYLKRATVAAMLTPHVIGESTRGLGWDMASPYSRQLGSYFPVGSVGHTGFTGTSIWMDLPSRSFAIVLTNRVHPNGTGKVVDLRRRVSAVVAGAFFSPGTSLPPGPVEVTAPAADQPGDRPSAGPTRTGLDRLVADGYAALAGRSVGLVTNHTGVDALGRRAVDLLAAAPAVKLRAIFSPEHGLGGQVDASVPHGRDAATGLPVWSLYGAERRPSAAMLGGIDTFVYDIQDVGVRYYTYLATLVYLLEEAAKRGIAVIVLDRPNPITGRLVEGPLMDPDLRSFTAPHAIPVRTGMTVGEFARMVVAERRLAVALTVIPMEGWERGRWYDETGLPWVNPSPNIRTPMQALLYAGVGLLEATNLSVGRGTDTPFEVIGAPWIGDPAALAGALNARRLPGMRFEGARFTPTASVWAGQPLGGVRMVVTDRELLRPVSLGLTLARELQERYPAQFRPAAIQNLLVNRTTMWALLRREPLGRVLAWAEGDRLSFLQRRASYLIY